MIRLNNISKSFKNNPLFSDVSLSLESKKIKIKGDNGVGKSVLLKIIVGYCVPDNGTVIYNNKELRKDSDFLENAGVSIDAPQFIGNWTGLENLMYLSKIKNICTQKELMKLVKYFSLEDDINKKYKTYSLGMRQKMRLIQALMDKPIFLILDEPFDALDQGTKELTMEYLNQYLEQDPNRQLIYTSHNDDDDEFADDVYLMREKEIRRI